VAVPVAKVNQKELQPGGTGGVKFVRVKNESR
jgi:hypothetical protein